jgi:hypothetical protein
MPFFTAFEGSLNVALCIMVVLRQLFVQVRALVASPTMADTCPSARPPIGTDLDTWHEPS